MKKKDRAQVVLKILNEIYPNISVPLNHNNNYELLIAVLLSAQCTDIRVNEVTPKLFQVANDPFKMQKISQKKIYDVRPGLTGIGSIVFRDEDRVGDVVGVGDADGDAHGESSGRIPSFQSDFVPRPS